MVKVIKKDKSLQAFKASKIVRACKRSGSPEPIAKTISGMVSKKVKKMKTVKSSKITKMVFSICDKVGRVPKEWKKFDKKKKKKKK